MPGDARFLGACIKRARTGESEMLLKKLTAIGTAAALLVGTSSIALAETQAEWMREQWKQRQYEELREQKRLDEETRRSGQDSDSSCGLGCKLFLGAAALIVGCAAGIICGDGKKPTEAGAPAPGGAAPSSPAMSSWRVEGVASADTLNMRLGPSAAAPVVGEIPASGRGIRISECRDEARTGEPRTGDLWTTPTGERWTWKDAVDPPDHPRQWCLVEYSGQRGWIFAKYLAREQ
jgi:hypothetical protein